MVHDGIRRRHSTHYYYNGGGSSQPDSNSAMADQDTPSGQAAAAMRNPLHPTRSRSYDHVAHVSFPGIEEEPRPQSSRGMSRRPGTPTLTVDTRHRAAPAPVSGRRAISPSSARSPGSVGSPKSASAVSPVSPRSQRDRGYSLRRSLFNRNIHDQAEASHGLAIEMHEPKQDNRQSSFRKVVPLAPQKESMDSSVSISEVKGLETQRSYGQTKLTPDNRVSILPNYESWIQAKAARSRMTRRLKGYYRETRKFILRIKEIPPSKDGRHIDVDPTRKVPLIDERTGKSYIDNTIHSSRYSAWNFLPRQLWAQFSKLANLYFLFVSILQLIPGLSTTGTYTTIVPLMFFVTISIAKEGYDDYRRYRLDKEEDNRETNVYRVYQPMGPGDDGEGGHNSGPKVWAKIKWKDVRVGDVVKLDRDDMAPADLVLLHSKGEDNTAYIETMALDGETNLKSKQPTQSLAACCDTLDRIAECNASVVVEDPNLDLHNFEGRVSVNGETAPLTLSEVIYRGSVLRNTPDAFGLVIYSGEECKMRMNASKNPRIKAPSLQSRVNKIIIVMVFFVIFLSIFNTVAYQIWSSETEVELWYLVKANVDFIPILVSFIVMYNTMIPLSLYVSLEIVKVFQRLLLNDIDMYDEASDTPMEARTSTINEELGQISHIFSDKTGTLTDNCMKFRKMSVAGTAWLHDSDLKADAAKEAYRRRILLQRRNKGKRIPPRPAARRSNSGLTITSPLTPPTATTPTWKSSARPTKAQHELQTAEMLLYMQRKPFTTFARKARFLLLSMALCNTCLPETKDDESIAYQASSPDELALVQAAQEMGYMMVDRKSGVITLKTFPRGLSGEPQLDKYEILDVIEFSSRRKRMSVVVKLPDGRISIMSKGADSVLVQRLRLSSLAARKASEIETRTSMRRSIEAREAMARKSEHRESIDALSRGSMALSRKSFGGQGRASMSPLQTGSPFASQLNEWLADREQDVDASTMDNAAAYTPRPSMQLERASMGISEHRTSSLADDDFELVEEALAVDDAAIMERCLQHVDDFATEGLRTLMYGYRFLGEEEYRGWKEIYHDATTSLENRQERIEKAGELIEYDFELAGATAIEDKLQKGVPETIDKLRRANIKIWMLTGDKRETAINIGQSCRLIKDYSTVTILDQEDGELEQRIASAIVSIRRDEIAHSVIVVDGQTLSTIEASQTLTSLFIDLAPMADSVVCCRASPSQKALLVRTVRRKIKKSITLAIGDGANDIAMIQEAHVGIGVTGKEGLQAARTSDYSIAQFRFLAKLLLVHGRWNYIRTCKYVLATFWKEMMFYLTQALYQRWTGYTGTSLYESWSLTTFNTLFSSLPVIILGIFEKDLRPATLLAVPELYTKGQRGGGFNFKIYTWWIFLAVSDSMLIFFLMFALYAAGGSLNTPADNNIYPLGAMTFTAVIVVISAKLQFLEMHDVSVANCLAALLSVGGWFLFAGVLSLIYADNTIYKVRGAFGAQFGRDAAWWATLGCILAAVAVLEVSARAARAALRPSDTDVFQQLERDPVAMRRFAAAAALDLPYSGVGVDVDVATPAPTAVAGAPAALSSSSQPHLSPHERAREQAAREGEIAELLRRRIGDGDGGERGERGGPSAPRGNSHDVGRGGGALGVGAPLATVVSRSAPPSVLDT